MVRSTTCWSTGGADDWPERPRPGHLYLGGSIGSAAGLMTGATVTIRAGVIAGKRAARSVTVPSVRAMCPTGPCPFALGGGGGIDNAGRMTLRNTSVADNEAGGTLTRDAEGGGVPLEGGSLTISHTVVIRNRASGSGFPTAATRSAPASSRHRSAVGYRAVSSST